MSLQKWSQICPKFYFVTWEKNPLYGKKTLEKFRRGEGRKTINFCHFLIFLSKMKKTVFQNRFKERKHQLG